MNVSARLMIALLFSATAIHAADDSPLPDGARVKVEGRVAFTEGPAWHPSGNVYFSDIVNNRIMRLDPKGGMHTYRTPSGRANGLLFDHQGRLLACEGGGEGGNRRVTRTELDGSITVLASEFKGQAFNSPNDLAIDSKGRVYFTDPRYGDRSGLQILDASGRAIEGVYRIDFKNDGSVQQLSQIITHEVHRPNGIHVSPDDRRLFVADNVNDDEGSQRKLWRFDLDSNGNIVSGSQKLLFDWETDRGPDGMAMDTAGRLYVAAGFNFPNEPYETVKKYKAGIYVISPEGKLIGMLPVPADMITNCTFGGKDLNVLYITAGHKLWSAETKAKGYVPWLAK